MKKAASLKRKLDDVYRYTFLSLPADIRESLNSYWQKLGVRVEGENHWPTLVIKARLYANSLINHDPPLRPGPIEDAIAFAMRRINHYLRDRHKPVIPAQCLGDVFLFRADFVKEAPEEILQIVIAEELAHAYQAAPTGKPYPAAAIGRDPIELEADAKNLAVAWGFDTAQAARWCGEHYGRSHSREL